MLKKILLLARRAVFEAKDGDTIAIEGRSFAAVEMMEWIVTCMLSSTGKRVTVACTVTFYGSA